MRFRTVSRATAKIKASSFNPTARKSQHSQQSAYKINPRSVAPRKVSHAAGSICTNCTKPSDVELCLPFNETSSYCNVGGTLLHLVKCTTEWGHASTSDDNCEVCKAERKAIIADIQQRVEERKHGRPAVAVSISQEENKPKILHNTKSGIVGTRSSAHGSHFTRLKTKKSARSKKSTKSQDLQSVKEDGNIEDYSSSRSKSSNAQMSKLDVKSDSSKGKDAKTSPSKRLVTGLNPLKEVKSKRNTNMLQPPGISKIALGATLSGKNSDISNISRVSDSVTSKLSYGEWDRVKEQTLAELYNANPDIERLFSMFLQVRRIRMISAEMSNTCNEAQALLDNTVSQLYQSMTEPCRENLRVNKMQDTDLAVISSLIQSTQVLRQQLQQFNIFDRDGVIKQSEKKIRERIRKSIALASKNKNKEYLTELILLLKSSTSLKCNDLVDTARRLVQGITYDNFITKHSNRLRQSLTSKGQSVKETERLRLNLNKVVQEITKLKDRLFQMDIESRLLIRLIETLELNLRRFDRDAEVSLEVRAGLDLYYQIIRGAIRKTALTNMPSDDLTKLRKVLKNHGNSLPLRLKTLEMCQLVDRFQSTKKSIEKNLENGEWEPNESDLAVLSDTTTQLMNLLNESELNQIVPEHMLLTIDTQYKSLLQQAQLV